MQTVSLSVNFSDLNYCQLSYEYQGSKGDEFTGQQLLLSSLFVRMFSLMKNRALAVEISDHVLMLNSDSHKTDVHNFLEVNGMKIAEGEGKLKRGFSLNLTFDKESHGLIVKPYGFGFLGKDIELYSGHACLAGYAFIDSRNKAKKQKARLNNVVFNTTGNAMSHYPIKPLEGIQLTEQMCRPSHNNIVDN